MAGELLPADPVMLERALDNCTQDPATWDYLYRTEALAMAAEIERLRERNAWLENYVKACDNEIKRARSASTRSGNP